MNTQLFILNDEPLALLQDTEGGIVYWPDVVPLADVARWFEALQTDVLWHSERRRMYERDLVVPRLLASIALDDPARPVLLNEALAAVRTVAPAPYTRVGCNFYRDASDSVAMHNDSTTDLVPRQPIAILSLGAPREMLIRAKAPPHRPTRIVLEPGSVLMMSYASQHTHEHGIPKCSHAVGPRISLAFRVRI